MLAVAAACDSDPIRWRDVTAIPADTLPFMQHRMQSAEEYIGAAGVPPDRLAASGRAEFSPVASNDDPEGRKRNRRIEITLIDKSLAQELQTSPK